MLNITKVLAASDDGGQRPGWRPHGTVSQGTSTPVPPPAVVVWNVTRRCNLHCVHCHATADTRPDPTELSTGEGIALIDDLARLGVPSLVLSGGEPLLREDTVTLARHAAAAGMRVALLTNGTLIDEARAAEIQASGVAYVGVSIDGVGPFHDRARGLRGAFVTALRGLRAARDTGLQVGVRFTLSRSALPHLDRVLDMAEAERVHRACVSHLVYVGRARRRSGQALSPEETRAAVERVIDRAEWWRREGIPTELVTRNNDADAAVLYLRLQRRDPGAAARAWRLLAADGGNASGRAIASVDYRGTVHPDQFWPHVTLGSVREQPLSTIWQDGEQPVLTALRDRRRHLRPPCGDCAYFAICGGGIRVRAEALTGDLWSPDPACHLTGAELGRQEESSLDGWLDPAARRGADDCPGCECAAGNARR